MVRISLVFSFCAGSLLAGGVAEAQCHGGTTGQGLTGATATALAGLPGGSGAQLFTGPGSFAHSMMMSQMIAQQVAQQRYMLTMQQYQLKQQEMAERRYRAEQNRAKVAASRARARAALVATNRPAASKPQTNGLLAFQPDRRR